MSGRWLDRGRRWGGPPAWAVAVGLAAPVPAAAQSELPFDSMEPTVRRQFVEAVRGLEAAPLDARAHGHLGMLYHAYELHASAEPYYRRAVDLAPGGIRWRYYLGVVLAAIGDPDAAVAQFDAVLAEAPGDIAALLGRAEADRTRNRLDDALAGFRRVITLAPRTPQAYGGAGQVLGRQGDLEGAVARYEAAIKFAADHPYVDKTRRDGGYKITGIPPGKYTLSVWHSTLGLQEKKIQVTAGGKLRQDFSYMAN